MIRWIADVESYDIEFRHIPSTSNTAADALSRPPEANPLICPLITDSPEHSWLNDYKSDPVTHAKFFDGSLLPETNFKHGRIWRVDRMIVPASRVQELIRNHHWSVLSGHWSAPKTRHLVERCHTFPGLPKAIDKFVECCDICQRTKSQRGRHRGLLKAIELP